MASKAKEAAFGTPLFDPAKSLAIPGQGQVSGERSFMLCWTTKLRGGSNGRIRDTRVAP